MVATPVRHLLVTNDFPPKVGGIQTYLWELWRRLPPDSCAVLTTAHPGGAAFDGTQPFRIERAPQAVLWPTPALARRIDALAAEMDAAFVVVDPALPLGILGPWLTRPYVVVAHGAEVAVPGRLPAVASALRRVLRDSSGAVAAGGYVAAELRRVARRPLPIAVVPPGVDTTRFVPVAPTDRPAIRARLGLPGDGPLVANVGRLVPRKGTDVLVEAAALLRRSHPDLTVAVAGDGRDRSRLEHLSRRHRAPVRFLGRVADGDLPDVYAAADVFAAPNRTRWAGLEQEGFGIVFLEAAACGVPQVAGNNGGAPEAVLHAETGLLVDEPGDPAAVAAAVARLLDGDGERARMGECARQRAVQLFGYDALAGRLADWLAAVPGETGS